jgi:cysteinyl-tRNA synthetase
LNISVALAHLFDFVRDVNNLLDSNVVSKDEAKEIHDLILKFDKALGVIGESKKEGKLPKEAEELIRKREAARAAKDWKTADEIREKLKAMGIIIEDTAQGAKWKEERH